MPKTPLFRFPYMGAIPPLPAGAIGFFVAVDEPNRGARWNLFDRTGARIQIFAHDQFAHAAAEQAGITLRLMRDAAHVYPVYAAFRK